MQWQVLCSAKIHRCFIWLNVPKLRLSSFKNQYVACPNKHLHTSECFWTCVKSMFRWIVRKLIYWASINEIIHLSSVHDISPNSPGYIKIFLDTWKNNVQTDLGYRSWNVSCTSESSWCVPQHSRNTPGRIFFWRWVTTLGTCLFIEAALLLEMATEYTFYSAPVPKKVGRKQRCSCSPLYDVHEEDWQIDENCYLRCQ